MASLLSPQKIGYVDVQGLRYIAFERRLEVSTNFNGVFKFRSWYTTIIARNLGLQHSKVERGSKAFAQFLPVVIQTVSTAKATLMSSSVLACLVSMFFRAIPPLIRTPVAGRFAELLTLLLDTWVARPTLAPRPQYVLPLQL